MPESRLPKRSLERPFMKRRALCTHTTVGRLYGDRLCQMCWQSPRIGWVYCCTQDYCGQVPPSYIFEHPEPEEEAISLSTQKKNEESLNRLAPWIERAILDGQYTHEQVETMVMQKIVVKAAVAAFESKTIPTASGTTKKNGSSATASGSKLPDPAEIRALSEGADAPFPYISTPAAAKPRVLNPCHYRVCHICRPQYRERAWLSLNEVLASDMAPPSPEELANRRISPLSVVLHVGVPKETRLERAYRELGLYSRLSGFETLTDYGWSEESLSNTNTTSETETGTNKSERNSISFSLCGENEDKKEWTGKQDNRTAVRSGSEMSDNAFHEAIIHAYRELLQQRQQRERVKAQFLRKRESQDLYGNVNETEADGGEEAEDVYDEFDVQLWREMNDELLDEASRTSLPDTDDGVNETDVEGGADVTRDATLMEDMTLGSDEVVAVKMTEEAVELNTVDMVSQV